jgi:hypothetical protein
MGIQWGITSAIYRVMIELGRRSCIIFSLIVDSYGMVGLMELCLNKTNSRVQVGKHFSEWFDTGRYIIAIAFQL